jgi:hypothetical protein
MAEIGPNLFELLSTIVHTIGVILVVFLIMNAYNKI